ncbi:hypothetical protein COY28_06940 [Candidatus Woesearchaeota archaeon CG_4_10_14_0_2_um_filter_57_5]|nr:MAG: hypothetical protein COY28_06940 [Candidatus Woesearchaeota archaeon CG_4_10_14_0_2_um_filter_57_5]
MRYAGTDPFEMEINKYHRWVPYLEMRGTIGAGLEQEYAFIMGKFLHTQRQFTAVSAASHPLDCTFRARRLEELAVARRQYVSPELRKITMVHDAVEDLSNNWDDALSWIAAIGEMSGPDVADQVWALTDFSSILVRNITGSLTNRAHQKASWAPRPHRVRGMLAQMDRADRAQLVLDTLSHIQVPEHFREMQANVGAFVTAYAEGTDRWQDIGPGNPLRTEDIVEHERPEYQPEIPHPTLDDRLALWNSWQAHPTEYFAGYSPLDDPNLLNAIRLYHYKEGYLRNLGNQAILALRAGREDYATGLIAKAACDITSNLRTVGDDPRARRKVTTKASLIGDEVWSVMKERPPGTQDLLDTAYAALVLESGRNLHLERTRIVSRPDTAYGAESTQMAALHTYGSLDLHAQLHGKPWRAGRLLTLDYLRTMKQYIDTGRTQ